MENVWKLINTMNANYHSKENGKSKIAELQELFIKCFGEVATSYRENFFTKGQYFPKDVEVSGLENVEMALEAKDEYGGFVADESGGRMFTKD